MNNGLLPVPIVFVFTFIIIIADIFFIPVGSYIFADSTYPLDLKFDEEF